MKIPPVFQKHEAGSTLLTSLLISAIIGVALASYLIMTQAQNAAVMRSQVWNSSIAVTEAGVEDALQLLNKYAGQFEQMTNWCTSASLAQDNWSALGGNIYFVRRYIGNSYYDAFITNLNNRPVINSVGYVPWNYACNTTPQAMLAAVGTPSENRPKLLRRKVSVNTRFEGLFNVAMAAIREIDFNGKNVQTDSFDSADPAYSDNGLYPLAYPNRQKDNGDVVTDLAIINALNVGNAKIKGQAKTGPNGTLGIGPNGAVGSKGWVESGKKGVEPGYYADDMNVIFPSVTLPATTWLPATKVSVTIDGSPYDYVLATSGDYKIPGFVDGIYVASNASVRVWVTGDVSLTSTKDAIRVTRGASMKMYMAGASFKVAGKGVVNDNGNAANFYLLGLPSNTSIQFNGNAAFTGAIYAPQADFSLGGGGSDAYDFVGASVSRTVRMNGHFNFHYDENLARNGMGRGYVPVNWKED